jgi:hypothetical protein
MRSVALVAALTALVAPASAYLYGCYPASANTGTLAYTDAVGNSPNKCSNTCITAGHGPAVIISGANVSSPVMRTGLELTVAVTVLLRVLPADDCAVQQRVQHVLPGLSYPVLRRPERHRQRLHQRLIWRVHRLCTDTHVINTDLLYESSCSGRTPSHSV